LCSITQEKLERDTLLIPCSHPADLLMAKTKAKYPKDFKCPRCTEEKFVGNFWLLPYREKIDVENLQTGAEGYQTTCDRSHEGRSEEN
jgi:transcription elongation factor Elf1